MLRCGKFGLGFGLVWFVLVLLVWFGVWFGVGGLGVWGFGVFDWNNLFCLFCFGLYWVVLVVLVGFVDCFFKSHLFEGLFWFAYIQL